MKKSPKAPAYRNPKLTAKRRTKDLLSRTLEEKAAQMICIWQQKAQTLVDEDGRFDRAKASRDYFQKVTNPVTALAPNYANYDGTPIWRTAANWSVDWSR